MIFINFNNLQLTAKCKKKLLNENDPMREKKNWRHYKI